MVINSVIISLGRSAHSDVDLLKDASFGSLVEANSQQSAELQKLHEQLKTAEDSNATLRLQVQKLKLENGKCKKLLEMCLSMTTTLTTEHQSCQELETLSIGDVFQKNVRPF